MKKRILCVLVLAFMAIGSLPVVMAQTPTVAAVSCPAGTTTYAPKAGDNLWRLEGPKWERLIASNSWLNDRITRRTADDVYALIRLTDTLCLPEGVTSSDFKAEPANTATGSPIKSATVEVEPAAKNAEATTLWNTSWFVPLLLILIALIVASTRWFWRRFNRPATSGTPVVQGGIPAVMPDVVEERFQRIAERRYADANPTANLVTDRPTRVGPIEDGILNGFGRVQYRGGLPQLRRMVNEPAYRARFRFPNGREEELQFLQACGNDVTYSGARYLGFTFTPGRVVIPTPALTPDVPTGPRAIPAIAARMPNSEQVLVTIAGMRMTVPAGSAVRMGENGEVNLTVAGPCDIRIHLPVKVRRPKVAKSSAAATA